MCGPTAAFINSLSGSQSYRSSSSRFLKHQSQSLASTSSCTFMELDSTEDSGGPRFGGWVKAEAMPQQGPFLVLGGPPVDSDSSSRSCVNSHSSGEDLTQDFVGDKFGGGAAAAAASGPPRPDVAESVVRDVVVQQQQQRSLAESECGPASLYASRSSSESFAQQPVVGDSSLMSTSNSSATNRDLLLACSAQGIVVPQRSKQSLADWATLMHKVQTLHDAVVADRGKLDAREARSSGGRGRPAISLGGENSAFNSVRGSCSKTRSSGSRDVLLAATTRSCHSSGECPDSDDRRSGGGNNNPEEEHHVADQACSVVGSPEHLAFPPKKRPFLATTTEEAQALEEEVSRRDKGCSSGEEEEEEELNKDEVVEEGTGHSLLSLGPPNESAQDYFRKPSKIPRLDGGGKVKNIFVDLNLSSDEVVPINDHIEVCQRVASGVGRKHHPDSASVAREEDAESNPGWTSERDDEARLGLSLAWDRSPLCHTPCTSVDADHKDAVEAASEAQGGEGVTSPKTSSRSAEEEEEDLPAERAWNFLPSSSGVCTSTSGGLEESQDRPLFWEGRYADVPSSNPVKQPSIVVEEAQTLQQQQVVSPWQQRTQSLFRVGAQRCQPAEEQVSLRNSSAVRLSLQSTAALFENPPAGMEAQGLSLVHLLLQCAEAAARNDSTMAAEILGQLYQGASLYGDSMQRIAAYFAEGLAARVVGKTSPVYSTLMHEPSVGEALFAFTALYKVSPYFQFAHFTANQVILEAMEGQELVHVVDLDIMQGFQWPSLIQSLAARAGGPPQLLRITGIGEEGMLRETKLRLESFASSFDIAFEFNAVAKELEEITPHCIASRPGEAMAVNAVFRLHTLLHQPTDHSSSSLHQPHTDRLHRFLRTVSKLGPEVVTLVEQEANHNASTFVARFVEALHYYAAVFDSLDASLPQQSEDRVKIEQVHFGTQIKNIVACEGAERVQRHETAELWQKRMKAAGFVQLPLSSHNVTQAKLLLQLCPCEGYKLSERAGFASLGWQERQLLSASAWACHSRNL